MTFAVILSIAISLILIISVYWYSKDWTAAGTVALACFGAVGMVFSYINTMELKKDRIPYVHVNFTLYEEKEHLIYVVVQNSGNAPAHDININVLPLDGEKEMLENGAIFSNFSDLSMVKHPIQFLAPNDSRRTRFGTVAGMGEYESKIEYELNVTYEDSSGHVYNSYMVLDVSHLMGIEYFKNKDSTVEVLNEIRKELNLLSENVRKISEPHFKSDKEEHFDGLSIENTDDKSDKDF